jgi:hypothetical protein
MPEPDAGTVCVEPVDELSVIVSVPDAVPVAIGENFTWIAQLAPAPRDVPQLLVCVNVAEPLSTMLAMLIVAVPVFCSVIVWTGV